MESNKIKSARITEHPRPLPAGMLDPLPQVYVKTEDGIEHALFDYYPDELSFTPEEFLGLTLEQAKRLKFEKDEAYLQS